MTDLCPDPFLAARRALETDAPWRTAAQIDQGRLIHSRELRRLAQVTQIHTPAIGPGNRAARPAPDPLRASWLVGTARNRLTHSLEVAQIACGIVQRVFAAPRVPATLAAFRPCDAQIGAIALAHDIGHPPFGHSGEEALDALMRPWGGFEGNAQSLRLLARLFDRGPERKGQGGNFSRRTLLGILKYPRPRAVTVGTRGIEPTRPVKAIYDDDAPTIDWLAAGFADRDAALFTDKANVPHRTFDCDTVDLADTISYAVQDVEDALELGLLTPDAVFRQDRALGRALDAALAGTANRPLENSLETRLASDRKREIGRWIGHAIASVELVHDPRFSHPLLAWRPVAGGFWPRLLDHLRGVVMTDVIRAPAMTRERIDQKATVNRAFLRLAHANGLDDRQNPAASNAARWRATCDAIAALTDGGCLAFGAGHASRSVNTAIPPIGTGSGLTCLA